MTVIKMKVSKAKAGREIAEMIRDHANSTSMPITIGINYVGEIGSWHNVFGDRGMAVALYNTEGGYDGLGSDADPETWDDSDVEAYGQIFTEIWIDEQIDREMDDDWNLSIEWPSRV